MQITFRIHYNTAAAQGLRLFYSARGNQGALTLKALKDGWWTGTIGLDVGEGLFFHYVYAVFEGDKFIRKEWRLTPRQLYFGKKSLPSVSSRQRSSTPLSWP